MSEKLPALKSKQVIATLRKGGFVFIRQRGSHAHYRKGILTVTVPMHSGEIKRGTLASILRQARLTVEEFKDLLL